MSRKPRRNPGQIHMPNGDVYVATVLKIQDRYENGIPENCTLVHDEACVELVGGEEFMIVYALKSMVTPRSAFPWSI